MPVPPLLVQNSVDLYWRIIHLKCFQIFLPQSKVLIHTLNKPASLHRDSFFFNSSLVKHQNVQRINKKKINYTYTCELCIQFIFLIVFFSSTLNQHRKVKHVTRVSDLVNVVDELNGFVGRRRSLVVGILGVLIKTHRQNRYTHRADCTLQHVLQKQGPGTVKKQSRCESV